MALADVTYAGLKSAVADWLARSDLTTAQVEDVILMFEAETNRLLRVRQMEASDTIDTVSGTDTLPTDYLSWRSLTWNGDTTVEIEYVHPTVFRANFPSTDEGTPVWFTIEGNNILVRPVDDDTTFTLHYWQKLPSLESAGDAGTNWLLTAHPDVYLAGSLYCAYKFLRDVDGAMAYKQLMLEGLAQIERLSERSKAPMAPQILGSAVF